MLQFVQFINRPDNTELGHNESAVIQVRSENRIFLIRVFHFTWSTGDTRIIVADIYKRLFGLPSLKITGMEGLKNGLISRYHTEDVVLAEYDPDAISESALNSIRATFAFRIMLGMRCNNDKTIVIRNRHPLSKRDMFWNPAILERGGKAKISDHTYKKWFSDNSDPISYVRLFPIWRNKTDEERLDMLFTINSAMYSLAVNYGCISLYNYTTKNIRRAILHH